MNTFTFFNIDSKTEHMRIMQTAFCSDNDFETVVNMIRKIDPMCIITDELDGFNCIGEFDNHYNFTAFNDLIEFLSYSQYRQLDLSLYLI